MKTIVVGLLVLTVSGCATTSDEVIAQYVSPLTYQSYTCDQIALEEARLSRKISDTIGAVDDSASNAKGNQAAAAIFFWPALFFTKQDKAKVNELSRLKGEYDALEIASIQKPCPTNFKQFIQEPPDNAETIEGNNQTTY